MSEEPLFEASSRRSRWSSSRPVLALALAVVVLTTFVVGFQLGRVSGERNQVPEGQGRVIGGEDTPAYLSKDVDFELFWRTWNYIKDNYYEQPVSDVQLFYGALHGLLSGAGDPYSVFFNPEETKAFNEELDGSFSGVGMEIGIRDDQLQVIAPLPETPAERAGLRAGDAIFAIDGEETYQMSVEDAVRRIRGERGTSVVLLVASKGDDVAREVTVVRDTIHIKSVTWEIDEQNLLIVKMSSFNEETVSLFREAIQEGMSAGVTGVVLDLRNDPGGLLEAAVRVAGEWVGNQPVVLQRVRGVDRPLAGAGTARLAGMPTVVLVNGGSASASEIVSGALKDYGVATIVGETTFGKGTVQNYEPLPDGSSVKLTIAEWLTPLGTSINKTGIEPDIEVVLTREDVEAEQDPQMDTARAILLGTYDNTTATADATTP